MSHITLTDSIESQEGYHDIRLPREVQMKRIKAVLYRELTDLQREMIIDIYVNGKTQKQIAEERGVCCSTVCRTLHRAENRLKRFLRY